MRQVLAIALLLLVLGIGSQTTAAAEVREWTDQTGSVKKTGEFGRLDGKWVHLKLADGQDLRVPLEWLSEADQAIAREAAGNHAEVVVVEGVGTDVESARRDAYRTAVRQVLGSLVDSETLVENDRLITDKVVVFSDGFVEKLEPLPEGETKDERGLVRLRVKAFVKAGKVADSLRAQAVLPASSKMDVPDADSLIARVLTTQERAANARDLFVAAAKDFPASCFQAEAFPLADKDVTVKESVVECRTRIKISARPDKYDEFVGRLVTFLEGGEVFARGDYQLEQMHPSKQIGQKYGFVGVIEQRVIGSIFPGDFGAALASSFDGLGESTTVALGQCTAYRAISQNPPWFDKTNEFWRRHRQRAPVIAVCRTSAPPYRIEWFVIEPSRATDWWLSMTDLAKCSLVATSQQGMHVAECSVSLHGIGIWLTGDGGPEIIQAEIFPGWVNRVAGPAVEFTLPITIPAAEFKAGLRFNCTLTNVPSQEKAP